MPFIGKSPKAGNFIVLDSITTSATATYNLTRNSTAYFPASARNLIVSLNGITQAPDTAYSVSGSTITFSSALTSSDVIDYILVLGDVLSIGTPADNTVGIDQLNVSDGTSGQALTTNGSGTLSFATISPSANSIGITELNVSDGTSGQALTTDGSGTLSFSTISTATPTLDAVTTAGATTSNAVTIGNLTSTGIDDNATSNAITIDASQNTTFAGEVTATRATLESATDSLLILRSTDDGGAYIEFERGTDRHAYVGFGGNSDVFKINNEETAGTIEFLTANTTAVTIDASQNTTFAGDVKLSNGASFGLGGQTQFTDFLGGSSDGSSDDGAFSFYGGRTFNAGAGVVLNGDDHATLPNVTRFVNGAFVERARISADGTFVFQNGIEEQQYNLTGTVIDPANGTIQYKTLGANTTFTESLSDGQFVTLMIDDGNVNTVTWPTITWIGGSAPVLQTSGYNVIELWQVNGTLYGAFVGAT